MRCTWRLTWRAALLPAPQLVGVISKKDLSKGGALVKVRRMPLECVQSLMHMLA